MHKFTGRGRCVAMSQTTSAVVRGFKEEPGRANVEPGRVSAVARDGGRGRVRSGTSGRVRYLSRGECGAGARRAARGVGGGGGGVLRRCAAVRTHVPRICTGNALPPR